ncbi:MAG TPA: hypothetical protein VGM88_33245 [Kofleriaceae bacterium]|jgi:neutral ceramidase
MRTLGIGALALCFVVACGDDNHSTGDAGTPDGSGADAMPDGGITTALCSYVDPPAVSDVGTPVTAGALQAGAAERVLPVPVGTALGGYTARAGFLASTAPVDNRKVAISGTFLPSVGFSAQPRVKALALTAGGETVVILKMDAIFVYEGMLYDVEDALGPAFHGHVIITASHSHSAWAQFTGHGPLKLGAGQLRDVVYHRFVDTLVGTAQDALAAEQAAKIGIYANTNFDPDGIITHDRRGENDGLPGGNRKDDHLYMIRVDSVAGAPIAAAMVFGMHGTLEAEDNPLATSDAPGDLERVMEEQFGSNVIVMHLQSAGADVSPSGHGGLDCNSKPGRATDPCFPFGQEEGHGRAALDQLMSAYTLAGGDMQSNLPISMLTRSIETGPNPATFSIRSGALQYAAWDGVTLPDGKVYVDGSTTQLASPIDEFNAPVGGALCQEAEPEFPAAEIPGDEGVLPYGSCLKLDIAGSILGPIFDIDFGVDDTHPVCEMTRTTISALRIGDYVIGTMPGELSVLLADHLRETSPNDAEHTILLGYAQGHVGYMLRPEDWVLGGYEPSVTFWGPLEAEYIGERLAELMPLAQGTTHADGGAGGKTHVATATITDTMPIDNPAPEAGTVPTDVPTQTWVRSGTPAQAQPATTIPRISGIATFVFYGDDPLVKSPHVTLMRFFDDGSVGPATRQSGRVVDDAELIVSYTPVPLVRNGTDPQHHVWAVEWQAVPWLGEPGLDSLDQRGGVPLTGYYFHVEGDGWTLDSGIFQVVAGGLTVGNVARTAGNVSVGVQWFAPKGWRLMDMNLPSNQPVPVRSQTAIVTLLNADGTTAGTRTSTTDANGTVTVQDAAGATKFHVADQFGNTSVDTPLP